MKIFYFCDVFARIFLVFVFLSTIIDDEWGYLAVRPVISFIFVYGLVKLNQEFWIRRDNVVTHDVESGYLADVSDTESESNVGVMVEVNDEIEISSCQPPTTSENINQTLECENKIPQDFIQSIGGGDFGSGVWITPQIANKDATNWTDSKLLDDKSQNSSSMAESCINYFPPEFEYDLLPFPDDPDEDTSSDEMLLSSPRLRRRFFKRRKMSLKGTGRIMRRATVRFF